MQSSLQTIIKQKLTGQLSSLEPLRFVQVGGGSINQCYRVDAGNRLLFCKVNSAVKFPGLFQKEKNGLERLAAAAVIKTPAVMDCFEAEGQQVLLLEWIEEGSRSEMFWKRFGEKLAALHRNTAPAFGLDEYNYMGSVPQRNCQQKTWVDFFQQERLAPMVARCVEMGLLSAKHQKQFEGLYQKLDALFEPEAPVLLHGDLWSGNFLCDKNNEPVLIDPAVYFGHRSVDLAMTTLFGGFQRPFYEAYHYHFPFPSNYEEQWAVCNLYPLLIHLYLFGRSYLPQIEATLSRFA